MTRPDSHYADAATERCDAMEQDEKKQAAARVYEVTLISGTIRIVRNVIAPSAVIATRAALSYMPCTSAPLAVICKPAPSPANKSLPIEEQPCAA